MKINVVIKVPDNWENRLDMQQIIEREIAEDRWSWNNETHQKKILSNLEDILVYGDKIESQDDEWHVFTKSGDSVCSADTIQELLIKWGNE